MAKKKVELPPVDPKAFWICEECKCLWEGVNPPDECDYCGHSFFDNMADIDPGFGSDASVWPRA